MVRSSSSGRRSRTLRTSQYGSCRWPPETWSNVARKWSATPVPWRRARPRRMRAMSTATGPDEASDQSTTPVSLPNDHSVLSAW
ncbi:hypothetical protein [Actinomadura madurae]|uniref:hypothetical protein n=1 Tax=Actinomadura madurae TaxID=1993 RepID=UPI0020D26010|nr:hypothetical protein [Actinomadura madurae]MCP9982290.1 hypothetical protein [Actinomadura madurae]